MEETADDTPPHMSRRTILKNVAVLSIGALLLFTAYDGLSMLQSTMNRDHGIGLISQSVIYAGFCISSLLFPKYVLTKLGSKRTFALSMLTYVPYIASNFYPHWILMLPSAVCIGLGASLLWGSQANYLNDIAEMYASIPQEETNVGGGTSQKEDVRSGGGDTSKETDVDGRGDYTVQKTDVSYVEEGVGYETFHQSKEDESQRNIGLNHETPSSLKNSSNLSHMNYSSSLNLHTDSCSDPHVSRKAIESTTAMFFGFHGMAYLSSTIWSNLLTYFLLKGDVSETFSNLTCVCGADFCNVESDCFNSNIATPSDNIRYILTAVCTCIGLFSILFVAVFLDPLETKRKEVRFSLELMAATCQIMKKKELILLIPYSFFIGQAKGFFVGDVTKSYVGCAWGAYHVGLVAVAYGASCGLSSSCSGWLVKRLGRRPLFTVAAAIHAAACAFLLLWTPDRQRIHMFFFAAVLWGAHVGASWAQLRALYGMLFKDNEEAAFAAFHAWYSLGYCLSFAYSNYLCTNVKIYVLLIVSTLGYIGYTFVERIQNKKVKS